MKERNELPVEILTSLVRTDRLNDGEKNQLISLLSKGLDKTNSKEFLAIVSGKRLPSLSSDIIAKKIFDPEEHPERLELLLQKASGEPDIHVVGPARMEGYVEFADSKRLIHDIPAALEDGRMSDTEIQVKAQEFIFTRAELYSSDLLLIQYSAKRGDKSSISYRDTKGTLLIILKAESPKDFKKYKTDRYIHRFSEYTADSGLTHTPLCKTVFIQLDKALNQLKKGKDGEGDSDFQLLLSAMKDINNPLVRKKMSENTFLSSILEEVTNLAKDKEVQIMMLAEKYAMADIATMKEQERAEGENIMLYKLVHNGSLKISIAAKEAGIEEKQFKANMIAAGYSLP